MEASRLGVETPSAAPYRKNEQPHQKMGGRSKQTVLQKRHTDGRETHEKMLNVTHYYRNANQNYCHLTLVQMAIIKKSTNNKCWRGCGKKGNPLTLLLGM